MDEARGYDPKRPDGDAGEKLAAVDRTTETPLPFIGRLIASKGPQNIVAALPPETMKLRADKSRTVTDIVDKTLAALALDGRYRDDLRRAAAERYDWTAVSGKLAAEAEALSRPPDGQA